MEQIAGDPVLAAVLALWESKRGERFAPHPSELDAFVLPPIVLPRVALVDVIEGGARFRFRLVGSAVALSSGVDYTGRYVDEALSGPVKESVLRHYAAVVRERRPAFAVAEYRVPGEQNVKNSRLAVPLTLTGETVDRLLLASRVISDWLLQSDLRNLERQHGHEARRTFILL
ncbi:MAG TPA: hypothetical protein VKZ79_02810 [Alphaproteobacteria bacterium]|nr:hypothetical protein [Alphaproteobacteria bacterium]